MTKEVSDRVVVVLIIIAVVAAVFGTWMVYSQATNIVQTSPSSGEGNVVYINPSSAGEVSVFVNPSTRNGGEPIG